MKEYELDLTYWIESKGHGKDFKNSISFQLFSILLRLRRGFNILTIAHWYGVNSIQSEKYWIPGLFLFHHFKDHRWYIMFPERQEFKVLYQSYFVFLKPSVPQTTLHSLNVKCHETTTNREIFTHHLKIIVQWNALLL